MSWAAAIGAVSSMAGSGGSAGIPANMGGDSGAVTFGSYSGNLTSAGSDKSVTDGNRGLDLVTVAAVAVAVVLSIRVLK